MTKSLIQDLAGQFVFIGICLFVLWLITRRREAWVRFVEHDLALGRQLRLPGKFISFSRWFCLGRGVIWLLWLCIAAGVVLIILTVSQFIERQELDERETLRLCRRDSQSLTVPGVWVAGKVWRWSEEDGRIWVKAHPGECATSRNDLHRMDTGELGVRFGWCVRSPPEGPSGFEPLTLRQASGFAGGR